MNEERNFVRQATVQLVAAHMVDGREMKISNEVLINKCIKIAEDIYHKTAYIGL